jgi:hypothetical protein
MSKPPVEWFRHTRHQIDGGETAFRRDNPDWNAVRCQVVLHYLQPPENFKSFPKYGVFVNHCGDELAKVKRHWEVALNRPQVWFDQKAEREYLARILDRSIGLVCEMLDIMEEV